MGLWAVLAAGEYVDIIFALANYFLDFEATLGRWVYKQCWNLFITLMLFSYPFYVTFFTNDVSTLISTIAPNEPGACILLRFSLALFMLGPVLQWATSVFFGLMFLLFAPREQLQQRFTHQRAVELMLAYQIDCSCDRFRSFGAFYHHMFFWDLFHIIYLPPMALLLNLVTSDCGRTFGVWWYLYLLIIYAMLDWLSTCASVGATLRAIANARPSVQHCLCCENACLFCCGRWLLGVPLCCADCCLTCWWIGYCAPFYFIATLPLTLLLWALVPVELFRKYVLKRPPTTFMQGKHTVCWLYDRVMLLPEEAKPLVKDDRARAPEPPPQLLPPTQRAEQEDAAEL